MARKFTENPSLDMTPMIDVVFELIIFFVVTLKMAVEKDETIQLEDGRHGIELTADELPPSHLVIDIAKNGRISMCNVTITPDVVRQRIKDRKRKWGSSRSWRSMTARAASSLRRKARGWRTWLKSNTRTRSWT